MIYYSIRNRLNLLALTLQVQFVLESMARTLAYSLCKLMALGWHYLFSINFQSPLLQLLLETCWNPLSCISFHSASPKFWLQVSSITQHLGNLCGSWPLPRWVQVLCSYLWSVAQVSLEDQLMASHNHQVRKNCWHAIFGSTVPVAKETVVTLSIALVSEVVWHYGFNELDLFLET